MKTIKTKMSINIVKVKESVAFVPSIEIRKTGEAPIQATTGRAKCCVCNKEIGEGTPRVRSVKDRPSPEHHYYRFNFFCYKCAQQKYNFDIEDLERTIKNLKRYKKELNEMIKTSKKEIMMMEL